MAIRFVKEPEWKFLQRLAALFNDATQWLNGGAALTGTQSSGKAIGDDGAGGIGWITAGTTLHCRRDDLTAAASDTVIALQAAPYQDSLLVWENGGLLPEADYVYASQTVTLDAAAAGGEVFTVQYWTTTSGPGASYWNNPVVVSGDLDDVTVGDAYTGSLSITGGTGTYSSYDITAGSLPTGMTLTLAGSSLTASGTSVLGSYSFSVTVTDDANNTSAAHAVTVEVSAPATLEQWNSADKNASITLSASDYTATLTTAPGTWCVVRGKTGKNSGKWYVRGARAGTVTAQGQILGLCTSGMGLTSAIGLVANSVGIQGDSSTGTTRLFADGSVAGSGTVASGPTSVPSIAVDFDAGKAWLRSDSSLGWIGGGDPAAGTSPSYTFTANTTLFVGVSIYEGSQSLTLPDDPADVTETIPSGFSLWTQ